MSSTPSHLFILIAFAGGVLTGGVWLFIASVFRRRTLIEKQESPGVLEIQKMVIRELHDGIGGIATNIAFAATLGRNETDLQKKDEWLDKLQVLAAEAGIEIRELMNALDCTSMEWADVIDAVRRVSGKAFGELEIEARIHVEGVRPTTGPGLLAGVALIRMARECINNVVQHAQADQVELTVRFAEGRLHLSIEDNGSGFDPDAVRHGRGLNRLEKRVHELHGSWNIDSTHGTRITIDIPLLHPSEGGAAKEPTL